MENKFSIFDSPDVLNGVVLPSYKNSVILMHPSDMKMLKLGKNHLVLLNCDEKKLIFRSLPCLSVPPSSVVLPSLGLFSDNLKNSVAVEVYNQLIAYAERIILTFNIYKHFIESEDFKRYLETTLDKLYLKEGLILCISYLGYDCRCVVKRIIGSSNKTVNHENINDDSLTFNELTLESSFICSTPKYSKVSRNLLPENIKNISNKNVESASKQFYVIYENTRILFEKEEDKKIHKIHFQDLCGLKEQIKSLTSIINTMLNQNSRPMGNCHGILLIGPAGTGKSITVQALGNEFHLPVISLNDIALTRNKEELKDHIQNLFKKAEDNNPSILFIDNIDVFSKSSHNKSEVASLLSTMLHHLMNNRSGIIVIGTARSISDVDSCLRKPGLLETEIYFGTPSVADRKEILGKILSRMPHTLNQEEMSEISERTHGFTGGDLELLCGRGIISSQFRTNDLHSPLHFEDLKKALKVVKPSAIAEYKFEVPKIKWKDIGGMHAVKKALTEMVNLKFAQKLKEWKMSTHRGVLLYGPPGCSKTMIAAALASESNFNFISVKGPELFRKYVGESENAMSQLFIKARSASPCIIFFDEIEAMSSTRDSTTGSSNVSNRLLNQLLVTIDGIDVLESPVFIIAATNRPDKIDESLLRPGRFDKLIYVPLPDSSARKEIFEKCIRNLPVSEDISISDLVKDTNGYSGAEVVEVCDEATSFAIEDTINSHVCDTELHTAVVTWNHFQRALEHVKPKTTKIMLESYEAFQIQRKCNLFN